MKRKEVKRGTKNEVSKSTGNKKNKTNKQQKLQASDKETSDDYPLLIDEESNNNIYVI